MPRLPGRESTRRTVDSTEGLLVASFMMPHEDRYWAKQCVVKDCEHTMGNVNWRTDREWKPCSEDALPAHVVHEDRMDKPVGMTCPCHTDEILTRD